MQNPFYVQPGGDYSAGLRGLSDVVGQIGERKREETAIQEVKDRAEAIRTEISGAMESKDPTKIRSVMAKYPKMAQGMKAIIETKFPGDSANKLKYAYFKAAVDFTQAPQLLEEMAIQFEADDVIDTQERQKLDKLKTLMDTNPEQAKKEIEFEFAILTMDDKETWDRYQDVIKGVDVKTPTTAMGKYIQDNPNATSEDIIKFAGDLATAKRKNGVTPTTKTYSKVSEDGGVRTLKNVKIGSKQESDLLGQGFLEGTRTAGAKPSATERAQARINKATDKLTVMANEDPNKFYEKYSYRQNEDGSLFIDPVSGGPQKLVSFEKKTGKRGNIKAIFGMGEQRDDAIELTELLELPSVQANLKKAEGQGFWDQTKSKWTNAINKWMQDQGIKGDSPTATAIARIQRMASEERKLYMGTAVTDNEMKSALAWMPNAGDSFDSVMNKTRLMGQEADQAFRRYVDVFEQAGADMSPFMNAFGIKKFGEEEAVFKQDTPATEKTDEELIKSLGL